MDAYPLEFEHLGLRKARADFCSSFNWMLVEPSVMRSSRISWICRSLNERKQLLQIEENRWLIKSKFNVVTAYDYSLHAHRPCEVNIALGYNSKTICHCLHHLSLCMKNNHRGKIPVYSKISAMGSLPSGEKKTRKKNCITWGSQQSKKSCVTFIYPVLPNNY